MNELNFLAKKARAQIYQPISDEIIRNVNKINLLRSTLSNKMAGTTEELVKQICSNNGEAITEELMKYLLPHTNINTTSTPFNDVAVNTTSTPFNDVAETEADDEESDTPTSFIVRRRAELCSQTLTPNDQRDPSTSMHLASKLFSV